jgi:hypothetical protein
MTIKVSDLEEAFTGDEAVDDEALQERIKAAQSGFQSYQTGFSEPVQALGSYSSLAGCDAGVRPLVDAWQENHTSAIRRALEAPSTDFMGHAFTNTEEDK